MHPYSICRQGSFWLVFFEGAPGLFEHEQGALYVAWLLLNPPAEPIHGLALQLKSSAYFGKALDGPGETQILDPATGEGHTLAFDAVFEQRNLALDDLDGLDYLRRKQRALESILEDATATEPVKAEVQRELEELSAHLKKSVATLRNDAQRAVRTVRMGIHRFHESMQNATDRQGRAHRVLRSFAAHLKECLLIPTSRYCPAGGAHTAARRAGCFTYEPPPGVKWSHR